MTTYTKHVILVTSAVSAFVASHHPIAPQALWHKYTMLQFNIKLQQFCNIHIPILYAKYSLTVNLVLCDLQP